VKLVRIIQILNVVVMESVLHVVQMLIEVVMDGLVINAKNGYAMIINVKKIINAKNVR
jgi:hypothetical protein